MRIASPAIRGRRPISGIGIGMGVTTTPISVRIQPTVSMKYLRKLNLMIWAEPYMGEPRWVRNRLGGMIARRPVGRARKLRNSPKPPPYAELLLIKASHLRRLLQNRTRTRR